MDDPRRLAALQHLVELSANVEAQFSTADYTPLKAVLSRAQDEAAEAMVKLTEAPSTRPDVIRDLQTTIWRYSDLVRWLREIVAEGDEAGKNIDETRLAILRGLVVVDESVLAALGINQPGAPSE